MLSWINRQRRWITGALALPMVLSVGALAATDSTAAKKDSMPAMAKDTAKADTAKKDTAAAAAAPPQCRCRTPTAGTRGTPPPFRPRWWVLQP